MSRYRATKEELITRASKRCGKCQKTKPLNQFHRYNRSDGYKTECKECRSQYAKDNYVETQRERAKARYDKKRAYFNKLKDKPCVDCGHRYPPAVMHFHHVKGPKLFNLGNAACRRSRTDVLAEASKCVLLCANCHILRHIDTIGNINVDYSALGI